MDVTERLWLLYARHFDRIADIALDVRRAYDVSEKMEIFVHRLDRQQFARRLDYERRQSVPDQSWLNAILDCADSDEERDSLRQSMELNLPAAAVHPPHFRLDKARSANQPAD